MILKDFITVSFSCIGTDLSWFAASRSRMTSRYLWCELLRCRVGDPTIHAEVAYLGHNIEDSSRVAGPLGTCKTPRAPSNYPWGIENDDHGVAIFIKLEHTCRRPGIRAPQFVSVCGCLLEMAVFDRGGGQNKAMLANDRVPTGMSSLPAALDLDLE